MDQLRAAGYDDVDDFFMGLSKENSSVYGWFGHQNEISKNITVKGEEYT